MTTSGDGVIETGTLRDLVARAIDNAQGETYPTLDAMPEPYQQRQYERADAALVAVNEWLASHRDEGVEAAMTADDD